ncbi:MAG: hypothetical protein C0467_31460 [Planctomycetaceae bacterium]|nr:hypothetical protein [Planctomycetaceae bacterium]
MVMSAFIVSEVTMSRAVAALATAEERANTYPTTGGNAFSDTAVALARAILAGDAAAAFGLADEIHESAQGSIDGLTMLGRKLYALNQRAIIARYGDRPDDDFQAIPEFTYDSAWAESADEGDWSFKEDECPKISALSCLLYQCSEGDVPNDPLYQRIQARLAVLNAEWKAGAAERAKTAATRAAERKAKERVKLLAENTHLVTKEAKPDWSSCRRAAENIRRELKRKFPGVKFSVTSDSFAGGNSIDVKWTDGPTERDVKAIAYRHSAGSFDGSTDSYNYAENVFGELFGQSKYVNCSREWTLEGVRKAYAKAHPGTQEVIDEGWYNRDYSNQDERSRIHWIRDAWNNCSL